jgi:hypothetical protein
MSRALKKHMNRVAELGCVVCWRMSGVMGTPAQLHHPREGQGGAQRGSNWLVIPLCPYHHVVPHGIHGDRTDMKILKVDEMDLLSDTIMLLSGG